MTTAAATSTLRKHSEDLSAALPPLMVEAERVADTVVQGIHGRRKAGRGDSFWQFRRYQPGDAATEIDWRQSARSQHLFVREKEWSAAQSVWLWPDRSESMDFRSAPALPTKGDRAKLLVLALASLLVRGGERVALLAPHTGGGRGPNPGQHALDAMALHLTKDTEDGDRQSLPPFVPLPRHGSVVLMGDFLSPLEEIEERVAALATRGVKGHMMQILDPVERTLPYTGRVRFMGLEGDRDLTVGRAQDLKQRYMDRMAARQEALALICRRNHWSFTLHGTQRPPQTALLALYIHISGALE